MAEQLVVVESPSKAKTLKKYLGPGYEVLASYGHVRDLVERPGSVNPQEGFAMKYELVERNERHVDAIVKAAKRADTVLLATDPDREGEAIAWHVAEILAERGALKKTQLQRVVFYEITESAVKEAVAHPRAISQSLVNAQQARRALDYLVGFNLSPLLWKKIASGLAAGRVQSPALRLIVEREQEIEAFVPREYWSLHLDSHKGKQGFTARLVQYRGEKVEQFTVRSEAQQAAIVGELERAGTKAAVARVEKKARMRQPAAPFITSTLQQEAVRKLGMTAERAMRTAQQLYEGVDIGAGAVGLITYMRTDSVNLANEAVREIRDYIGGNFDHAYLPKAPVQYRSKVKNAQEAHEAIRPTSIFRTPEAMRQYLSADQARLYELIWKRTLACQMTPARFDTVSVDLTLGGPGNVFRATGQTLVFPGFIAVYQEDQDDAAGEEEAKLPPLEQGEAVPVERIYGEQHFTQPPPRYSEASLVKTLEEHGIGRPSTYASIISKLQEKEYAVLEKKRFVPTDVGRLVNGFLTHHFSTYVDYGFTAEMEEELDEISNGELDWVRVLQQFWKPFQGQLQAKEEVERGCELPAAEPPCSSWEEYSRSLLEAAGQERPFKPETCPDCGRPVILQNSRRGLFVGCSGYPECKYTRPWKRAAAATPPRTLGTHPETGQEVLLIKGPYGYYVQLGPTGEEGSAKPKRVALPRGMNAEQVDLDLGTRLLSLPRQLGAHPQTGKPISAGLGRFGPYVVHEKEFRSLPKTDNVLTVTLQRALELFAQPKTRSGVLRELGPHPSDGAMVALCSGRYGPYVRHGKTNATLLKGDDPATLTLERALELLERKAARGGGTARTGPARKTKAKAKTAA